MAIGYRCEGCNIVRGSRWIGPCPGCGRYYAIRRTVTSESGDADSDDEGPPPRGEIISLGDVTPANQERIQTGLIGLDRILGTDPVTGLTGIAAKAGQAIQICGAPGGGKSTLLLQACRGLTTMRHSVLYITNEESLQQVKVRADRVWQGKKIGSKMTMLEEQDLDAIISTLEEVQPEIAIIDSMQTITVEDFQAGSPTAIRLAARELYKFSQTHGIGLFLVTQMNKTGDDFAGPKEIEHIVDTSLFLSVNRKGIRTIESMKNRFGVAPAWQRFTMEEQGLVELADEPEEKEPEPPIEDPPKKGKPSLIIVP